MTKWRLGIDVGTNSIGWAVIGLSKEGRPNALLDTGVRIFSDGRDPDKQSLAAQRRAPRAMRRNRDRYLLRRKRFMERLIKHGLMPTQSDERKKLENLDPWELRVRGLDERLSLHELGRALFHLQQRRGFKSNRKTDKGDDDESGKIKSAASAARQAMAERGARTLGEFLAAERVKNPKSAHTHPVRARLHGSGARAFYDFYPTRDMIEEEFDALWDAQAKHHGDALNDEVRKSLHRELFFQRPLKPQPVGKCLFIPTDVRAPSALPSVQRLRIYQEINHLKIHLPGAPARFLTLEERDLLVDKALKTAKLTFDAMRKTLKLPEAAKFNFESLKRKHFDGDKTAAVLAASKRWGKAWRELSLRQQDAVVEILLGQEPVLFDGSPSPQFEEVCTSVSDALGIDKDKAGRLLASEQSEEITGWLADSFEITSEAAHAVVKSLLPPGHSALGRTAGKRVLEQLSSGQIEAINAETGEVSTVPCTYDQSVNLAGFEDHAMLDIGEKNGRLPYYGEVLDRQVAFGTGNLNDPKEKRLGKIANPTVHVVLNQTRRVVNKLIQKFGQPQEIVVELARDLPLSAQGKKDLEAEQKKNQNANDKRRQRLAELKQQDNYDNRLRLRLWEELNPDDPCNRRCPYTGEQISIERLFSPEVEIDHILPFSQTLDDGFGNKTLCIRQANRDKAQRTPYDAFYNSSKEYKWDDILSRVADLPPNKAWRFSKNSMDRFEDEERDFLDRQLNDTKYAARIVRQYLTHSIPSEDPLRRLSKVWVTPGRLTSDLRHAWGLNSILVGHNKEESADPKKNRNDHRHHAIDAVIIGLVDRGLLQRVSTNAARAEKDHSSRFFASLKDPWPGFRDTVRSSIQKIVVSHKPEHGREGALHEDTNYGVVQDPLGNGERLVSRKPLVALTAKEVSQIGDLKIRSDLIERTKGLDKKDKNYKKRLLDALTKYGESHGVRRVRIHKVEGAYKTIHHGNGHMRAVIPGENYCVDILELPDRGWTGFGISVFEINQPDFVPIWQSDCPNANLVMRVHKGDLLRLTVEGRDEVMVVRRLDVKAGRFKLARHLDAGMLDKRHKASDSEDSFRWLMAGYNTLRTAGARLVHVDEIGRIYDPGPPQ